MPEVTIGSRYGLLKVESKSPERVRGYLSFVCLCECGTRKPIAGSDLLGGRARSCGCLRRPRAEHTLQIPNGRFWSTESYEWLLSRLARIGELSNPDVAHEVGLIETFLIGTFVQRADRQQLVAELNVTSVAKRLSPGAAFALGTALARLAQESLERSTGVHYQLLQAMAGAYFAAYFDAMPAHRRDYARERIIAAGYRSPARSDSMPIDRPLPGKPTAPARSAF
jgi:hypothetical protein